MATNPYPCSGGVNGWGASFTLYNDTGGTIYAAVNNGGSYFKHVTAPNGYIQSSETLYIQQLANGTQSMCQQLETMGGVDTWYAQLSTAVGGGGFVQGSGTGSIGANDSAVVAVATSVGSGIQLALTSYPSGTIVATFQLSTPS